MKASSRASIALASFSLLSVYVIPIFPGLLLGKLFSELADFRFPVLLLAAYCGVIFSRTVFGVISNVITPWIEDLLYAGKLEEFLVRGVLSTLSFGENMTSIDTDLRLVSRYRTVVVDLIGQSVSIVGILVISIHSVGEGTIAIFAPALLVLATARRSRHAVSRAYESVQCSQTSAQQASMAITTYRANISLETQRSVILDMLQKIFLARASAYGHLDGEMLRYRMLNRVLSATGLLISLYLFRTTGAYVAGKVAFVLAYTGSVQMLTSALLDNVNQLSIMRVATQRLSFPKTAAANSYIKTIDLTAESFRFDDIEQFSAITGISKVRFHRVLYYGCLNATQLDRLSLDGSGLSRGEGKRAYLCAILASKAKNISITNFKEGIDDVTFFHIVQRIEASIYFSRFRNIKVIS